VILIQGIVMESSVISEFCSQISLHFNIIAFANIKDLKTLRRINIKPTSVTYTLDLSPTLREEHKLRVFEHSVLRRIFGPTRDEVTGGWRKLHNEELHNLYFSPNIIRMTKSRMI
jgi:hypothetical protein